MSIAHMQPTLVPSWRKVLLTGAAAGTGLTFAYALLFALYAIVRSSASIWATIPPDINLLGTLSANAASITVASLATAVVLALVMALLGMGTAVVIKGLDSLFNPTHDSQRAILIGCGAALAFVLVCQFAVNMLMGGSLSSLGGETYLFWLGLPALIHIGTGAAGAWTMNQLSLPR
jgi:hypothetical protein